MSAPHVLGPELCPEDCPPVAWRLFCAAANGDLDAVHKLLKDRPELMHHFVWYECPLHYAVRENRIEVVRALLNVGINPAYSNFTYSSWQTLLPVAEQRGFDEVHALLVAEMQRRFNYDPSYGPLWQAILAGDVDDVEKQLSGGEDRVNVGDEHGNRALHWAVLARQIPVIRQLIEAGADLQSLRADCQSPLHLAMEGGDYWFGKQHQPDPGVTEGEVVEFLRANGAADEFTVLVALNDLDRVRQALSQDRGLAGQLNAARRSPLYLAAARGHQEMVDLLLDNDADPNQAEHCATRGRALFEAAARNDLEMMTLLLDHGAEADAYVDSSGNCLSIAQQGGPREEAAVNLLKRHGALPGEWELDTKEKVLAAIKDESFAPTSDPWCNILTTIIRLDDGELIQAYVQRFGANSIRRLNPSKGWRVPLSEAMLSELMHLGMDVNAPDWFGRTCLHYAVCDDTPHRTEWLLDHGAHIDLVDHLGGTTPLGLAAWNGRLATVDVLLRRGAAPRLPETEWGRPLLLATQQGHADVVARLREVDGDLS